MKVRAAIFEQAGRPFRIAPMPLPAHPGEGEVLVQVSLATICGSDLHTIAGRRQEPVPCVLGHEAVGRVVDTGAGREAWQGKRVTWTLADSCGECAACTEYGLPQKCERLFKYGHAALSDGTGLNGTYASHILLRRGTHLVAVPDAVPDAVAASVNCSLATMAAVTEYLPQPCRTAVVQGAGLLGLHGCALLRAAGVARVLVIDPDPGRLEKAAAFGGEPATSAEIEPGSVDVVVEAAGVASIVPEGLRMLRVGGHYLFAGLVHPDSALEITGETIIRRCLTLRGFHNYAPRHLERAVDFLRETAALPWASLVSPPLQLEKMDEAVALAQSRRWARVALTMDS
jgi:putative phosphonate catabolism associated alcohol dehydrogenase